MRTIRQPGTPEKPRLLSVPASNGGELRLVVAEGRDLVCGLIAALSAQGIRSAAIALVGGTLARARYLTCIPCDDGEHVVAYAPPTEIDGPIAIVGGNGFLGVGEGGQPVLHCHAVLVGSDGKMHGGHLLPSACPVGRGGAIVHAAIIDGATLTIRHDDETNLPVFHPAAIEPATVESGARDRMSTHGKGVAHGLG